jgi:hypothetical protein
MPVGLGVHHQHGAPRQALDLLGDRRPAQARVHALVADDDQLGAHPFGHRAQRARGVARLRVQVHRHVEVRERVARAVEDRAHGIVRRARSGRIAAHQV